MKTAAQRLGEFIVRRGLGRQRAATELNVSVSVFHGWLHGARPQARHREAIEVWSGGKIPATAWETAS